jgi:hypothetical protein
MPRNIAPDVSLGARVRVAGCATSRKWAAASWAEKHKPQWQREKFRVYCGKKRVYSRFFRGLLAQCPPELAGVPK